MNKLIHALAIAGITLGSGALTASASSHREAPAIAEDPYVDNTDVYAFISPNDANKLVIVADYVPLLLPTSGPNSARVRPARRRRRAHHRTAPRPPTCSASTSPRARPARCRTSPTAARSPTT